MLLSLPKEFHLKDNSVINYHTDLLSLTLSAGVSNKPSCNPFRKKYFLLLKIVLAKYKSTDPCRCFGSLRDISQHPLFKWLSGGIKWNLVTGLELPLGTVRAQPSWGGSASDDGPGFSWRIAVIFLKYLVPVAIWSSKDFYESHKKINK